MCYLCLDQPFLTLLMCIPLLGFPYCNIHLICMLYVLYPIHIHSNFCFYFESISFVFDSFKVPHYSNILFLTVEHESLITLYNSISGVVTEIVKFINFFNGSSPIYNLFCGLYSNFRFYKSHI